MLFVFTTAYSRRCPIIKLLQTDLSLTANKQYPLNLQIDKIGKLQTMILDYNKFPNLLNRRK